MQMWRLKRFLWYRSKHSITMINIQLASSNTAIANYSRNSFTTEHNTNGTCTYIVRYMGTLPRGQWGWSKNDSAWGTGTIAMKCSVTRENADLCSYCWSQVAVFVTLVRDGHTHTQGEELYRKYMASTCRYFLWLLWSLLLHVGHDCPEGVYQFCLHARFHG